MSHPKEPDPVKLISSLFSPEKDLIDRVIGDLEKPFGPVDRIGPECFFDRTEYYAREMGWPLYRRFISFGRLAPPDHLAEIKLKTIGIERKYLRDGKRLVNIDPGYISPERLILATGKNYVHRVYLSKGIYADLTLVFQKGSFRPLQWTYPDYAEEEAISLFNEIRKQYMEQLRRTKSLD
ncbi:MAG: DUF4416 family protein [Deltaproteobacteria bacterium]|nr:DUF4416 family protein [Deltaproteobacteria bacterium]